VAKDWLVDYLLAFSSPKEDGGGKNKNRIGKDKFDPWKKFPGR